MSDVTITMEDDNLSVVDKPMMSTQAIVFIALASASAAFTLGAGIWCLFYGAFGRGLRQRRCREAANRVCRALSIQHGCRLTISNHKRLPSLSCPPLSLSSTPRPRPKPRPRDGPPSSVSHGSLSILDPTPRKPLPTWAQLPQLHPPSVL